MDINRFAAKKLKKLRIKKGITQEELAEYLGTAQQQIEDMKMVRSKEDDNI